MKGDCPLCDRPLPEPRPFDYSDPPLAGKTTLRAVMPFNVRRGCVWCGQGQVDRRWLEHAVIAALGEEMYVCYDRAPEAEMWPVVVEGEIDLNAHSIASAEVLWAAAVGAALAETEHPWERVEHTTHRHRWAYKGYGDWTCKCKARIDNADRPPPGTAVQQAFL